MSQEQNVFVILAVGGLVLEIGLQAAINMASTLDLIPTKGMTLPFISFGGSSMLSVAITCGFILALTRRRPQGLIAGHESKKMRVGAPVVSVDGGIH